MKKYVHTSLSIFSLVFVIILLGSCVKDTCKQTYTYSYYIPVYKTTAEVKAGIKSSTAREVENPGKIVLLGNYIFLNEVDKGIHVIDNRNPALPRNAAFISIPGNMDLAIKGNILYADLYTDLVTLDISDPLNVVVKKYDEGVFPFRAYGNGFYNDSTKIITDWIKRDTAITQNCSRDLINYDYAGSPMPQSFYTNYSSASSTGNTMNSSSPIGQGGSMARFTIVGNTLYTVSNTDLNVFNISVPNNPVYDAKINVGTWNVETIFPFKDKLLIGTQNGMLVYNINNPGSPTLVGQFSHVQSCDPVIADGDYAYVTLRTGTTCFGNTNALQILKLNSFTDPQLLQTYSFTNPHGLSKDGKLLFICDGNDGLKIYDATDINNLKLIKQFSDIETYDVIAYNYIALVVAKDGLYQFDYSNENNIHAISKIGIANQ
jgi:hypothetical protein